MNDLWEADFGNDPDDDGNIIVEIQYQGEYVGVIKQGKNGLVITWYEHKGDLVLPLEWFQDLIEEVKEQLKGGTRH